MFQTKTQVNKDLLSKLDKASHSVHAVSRHFIITRI